MLTFIKSDASFLDIELDIMNSQPEYNLISSGREKLTLHDIRKEHLEEKVEKERYIISWEGNPVGIIDFTMNNPKDLYPWLGLFIIHTGWERKGLAQIAYQHYENLMIRRQVKTVRLGCLEENEKGLRYWRKLGFGVVKKVFYRDKPLLIMEKDIVKAEED
ncbi:hypothetical protein AB685_11070 [Bacillus sp. LL01]|uniref:GNAT family N-acetyltransferase n=1 Tax=Bacillus sp. LL01 TaxID=1665556 RepID=UPI00064D2593|nr:GNAT family N-acetyltransferase [Bacillus sp. LL01]KMJ58424.1 hypothetical protein AB685_11070 [Bacillus sp. LL01]